MIIQIEPQSDIPIYTQLTKQMIEGLARGDILPGDPLPSVRSFAADLGVNMHTVNKSYRELEKKGIVHIVPKSGAVIRTLQELKANSRNIEGLTSEFKPLIAEALVYGMDEKKIQALVTSIIHQLKG